MSQVRFVLDPTTLLPYVHPTDNSAAVVERNALGQAFSNMQPLLKVQATCPLIDVNQHRGRESVEHILDPKIDIVCLLIRQALICYSTLKLT